MAIKAVIFDLDGTITKPYLDFDAIRKEMGLTSADGPVWEAMEKMSVEQRQHTEKILHFHEDKAVTESALNPGAKQTLSALRKVGIGIGILTRNRKENALAVAKKLGFDVKKKNIVEGRELALMNDKEFEKKFKDIQI